jgi:gluconokinase
MSSGIPLTDDDRLPWLTSIATWIGEREAAGVDCIVTCSALRRSYRAFIREGHPSVWFAHLVAPPELVAERLAARTDHFMAPSLLGSQLDLLEDLEASERGARFAASSRPDRTADQICAYLEANGLLRQDGR